MPIWDSANARATCHPAAGALDAGPVGGSRGDVVEVVPPGPVVAAGAVVVAAGAVVVAAGAVVVVVVVLLVVAVLSVTGA